MEKNNLAQRILQQIDELEKNITYFNLSEEMTLTELKSHLQDILSQKQNEEKREYYLEALDYCAHLDCEQAIIKEELDKIRKEIATVNIDDLTNVECEEKLSRYRLLMTSCLEKDMSVFLKHYSDALLAEFGPTIFTGISAHMITYNQHLVLPEKSNTKPKQTPPHVQEPASVIVKQALPMEKRSRIRKYYRDMLLNREYYIASSYLKALSLRFTGYDLTFRQLSCALDDPLNEDSYTADNMYQLYFVEMDGNDLILPYLAISAVLRTFLYKQNGFNYSWNNLHAVLFAYDIVQDNQPLIDILNRINQWKKKTPDGIAFLDNADERSWFEERCLRALKVLSTDKNMSEDEKAGKNVLRDTLIELIERLSGTFDESQRKYFYLDFLTQTHILLDENMLPDLCDIGDIDSLYAYQRIEQHFLQERQSLEASLSYDCDSNYGMAKILLNYFRERPQLLSDTSLLKVNFDKKSEEVKIGIWQERVSIVGDMELALSYGQIDRSSDIPEESFEAIISVIEKWYLWAEKTSNYGFYFMLMDAIRDKVLENAENRSASLENVLAKYCKDNPGYNNDIVVMNIIQNIRKSIDGKNYTAAEDMLNRLNANDYNTYGSLFDKDHFKEFLKEYDTIYDKMAHSDYDISVLLPDLLPFGRYKFSREVEKIIEYWPDYWNRSSSNEISIMQLLSYLGFRVEKVSSVRKTRSGVTYDIKLQKSRKGRQKYFYAHPMAVFGSKAEDNSFRIVVMFGRQDAQSLVDHFREMSDSKNVIVLLDFALDKDEKHKLAKKIKLEVKGKVCAVIDRVVLAYLLIHYSDALTERMLMALIMPYASYQPYVSDSLRPIPPEMFIGRRDLLDKIKRPSDLSILYGGRQLGKSALLKMAQKEVDFNVDGERAVMVDIKNLNYKEAARRISEALSRRTNVSPFFTERFITEDWNELADHIIDRFYDSKNPVKYFLLLLDEADAFIESCATVNYLPFEALKSIQHIGEDRFKFVIAGLRNVVRFQKDIALGRNSVLSHIGYDTVKPFSYNEARQLLEEPLHYLGFRFEDSEETEQLIASIFGTTNYFPGLIQLYCTRLIEAVQRDYAGYRLEETPPYIIKKDLIKRVLSEKILNEQIYEKFRITLDYEDDNYYNLIALLVAYNYRSNKRETCTAAEVLEIAEVFEIDKIKNLKEEQIHALMEELEELNIFKKMPNESFRFSRKNFLSMMGNEEKIDQEIARYSH